MEENNNKDLIEKVLKNDPQDIAFEPIPEENDSPLAQPVVQKINLSSEANASKTEKIDLSQKDQKQLGENSTEQTKSETSKEPLDAPEQEINADPSEQESGNNEDGAEEEFAMPMSHAKLMADSLIGMVNNTIFEVGAGYFVTISKHKDFYDFEEVIQVIDEQNVKNIKRIKLDEEDKALLRPLLIQIIRRKAKALSPEAQMLGVALSIIIKKAKVVLEIRVENEILVERIRDIIRKEVHGNKDENNEEEDEKNDKEDDLDAERKDGTEVEYEETVHHTKVNRTGLPESVLET